MKCISKIMKMWKTVEFNIYSIFFEDLHPAILKLVKEVEVQIAALHIIQTYHVLTGEENEVLQELIALRLEVIASADSIMNAHKLFGMDNPFGCFSRSQAHDLISIADIVSEGAFKKIHDGTHALIFRVEDTLDKSDTIITEAIKKHM